MTGAGVIPPLGQRQPWIQTVEGPRINVGADGGHVFIGMYTFDRAGAGELARRFVAACWDAGENERQMREDVVEATIHAADCMNPGCEGECDG
jgi:hypothetical protein